MSNRGQKVGVKNLRRVAGRDVWVEGMDRTLGNVPDRMDRNDWWRTRAGETESRREVGVTGKRSKR